MSGLAGNTLIASGTAGVVQVPPKIRKLAALTVDARLSTPIRFGDWVISSRTYAIVAITDSEGATGWSAGLTRGGQVAEQLRASVAPCYEGELIRDPIKTYLRALRSNPPVHSSGVGLRALSLADLAVWDLVARRAGQPIARYLGNDADALPATAIVGYPHENADPSDIESEVAELSSAGWRRFKAPVGSSLSAASERLAAIRRAAPTAWVGLDAAWTLENVATTQRWLQSLPDRLDVLEDPFPIGSLAPLRELRAATSVPISAGDEDGGPHYPGALVTERLVDVVRFDLTCMGGISGGRAVVEASLAAGLTAWPHMFPHVHSQVVSGWGLTDVPIEWGMRGNGVSPLDDSLQRPVLSEGRMQPLDQRPGFGRIVDSAWLREQPIDDPQGLVARLEE